MVADSICPLPIELQCLHKSKYHVVLSAPFVSRFDPGGQFWQTCDIGLQHLTSPFLQVGLKLHLVTTSVLLILE